MGLPSLLSPQGISSRNCMEASETGGGSETICHLQALLGNGVKGDEALQALRFGSESMRWD
jgi:hypothetical protein